MVEPLVSVVIPTANRPQYLPRAVASALASMDSGDIEVIVVPNGPNESWKESLKSYLKNPNVRIAPVRQANANIARNIGLSKARGDFVRFLDDDDYLFPEGARNQYLQIIGTSFEVSSGKVLNLDISNKPLGLIPFPDTDDFVSACTYNGFSLPTSHVFKRCAIEKILWDPKTPRLQDHLWMIKLAEHREWRWLKCNDIVGVWFQHPNTRTSITRNCHENYQIIASHLFSLLNTLRINNRLSDERLQQIIKALWHWIHTGFPMNPVYWHRVATKVLKILPLSHPPIPFFQSIIGSFLGPLFLEWLILPKRIINHTIREAKQRFYGIDYRRII